MTRRLRLATRGSPLAVRQADLVAGALAGAAPGVVLERVVVRTEGDRRGQVPLFQIAGRGVFVKEVQAAVLDGRADVAVHSAKDLPPEPTPGLVLAAVPRRADVRDALVGASLRALPPGGRVATGSVRRRAQLADLRPDLTFTELRGNMARRLDAVAGDDVAAVVVAMAAMERLGWTDRVSEVLPVAWMLPQAGQGAIALECRTGDRGTAELLGRVDNEGAHRCVVAERAVLSSLGGSCAMPFGALARAVPGGRRIHLRALLATGDGRVVVRAEAIGEEAGDLGAEVAHRLAPLVAL